MLFLNRIEFNAQNYPTEYREFEAKLKDYGKLPRPTKILNRRNIPRINKTGEPEAAKTSTLPLVSVIEGKEWIYSDIYPTMDNGKVDVRNLPRRNMHVRRNIQLDPVNDAELLYYILEKSSVYKKGSFVMEDKAKDAMKKVASLTKEGALLMAIFSDKKPDDNKLRILAQSWGIGGVDMMSIEEIQESLYTKVKASEANKSVTKKGIDEFVQEVLGTSFDKYVTTRALIQRADEKKIIELDHTRFSWKYRKTGEEIMHVPASKQDADKGRDALADFLIIDNGWMERIRVDVEDSDTPMALSVSEVSALDYKTLQQEATRWAQKYNHKIKIHAGSRVDLEAFVVKCLKGEFEKQEA